MRSHLQFRVSVPGGLAVVTPLWVRRQLLAVFLFLLVTAIAGVLVKSGRSFLWLWRSRTNKMGVSHTARIVQLPTGPLKLWAQQADHFLSILPPARALLVSSGSRGENRRDMVRIKAEPYLGSYTLSELTEKAVPVAFLCSRLQPHSVEFSPGAKPITPSFLCQDQLGQLCWHSNSDLRALHFSGL